MTSIWQVLGVVIIGFFLMGCNLSKSTEILILLPGNIDGNALILAETSPHTIKIVGDLVTEDLVPSLILEVWWNADVIVTKNHPVYPRNSYSGDTIQFPDRKVVCWYLVHPATDSVIRYDDYVLLQKKLRSLGVNPADVNMMRLWRAQKLREQELGFKFDTRTVYQYLREQKKNQGSVQ